jgi:hypothetical protein
LYELFNISDWRLDGVCLPAIARQMPKMLGLFFVVVFGSSLDVASLCFSDGRYLCCVPAAYVRL